MSVYFIFALEFGLKQDTASVIPDLILHNLFSINEIEFFEQVDV